VVLLAQLVRLVPHGQQDPAAQLALPGMQDTLSAQDQEVPQASRAQV